MSCSALHVAPPSAELRKYVFHELERLSCQIARNPPDPVPAIAGKLAFPLPPTGVSSVRALQVRPESVERRTYTCPGLPTAVAPVYSATRTPFASLASAVVDDVSKS